MRNLTLAELTSVSGGSKEVAVLGGLAVVSVMALGVMIMSSSSAYPSNIQYMTPHQAYDQGYSNGYYASYGLNVILPDLLNLIFVVAASADDSDDYWY